MHSHTFSPEQRLQPPRMPHFFVSTSPAGAGAAPSTIVRGIVVMRDDEVIAEGRGEPVRFLETLAG